jgi:hypothetical protein
MTTKNYTSKTARLVQEATGIKYTAALTLVSQHEVANNEKMPAEARALKIIDSIDNKIEMARREHLLKAPK